MANIYTSSSVNIAQPVACVGSTAFSGAPADNVADYLHPNRPAIATGNASGTTHFGVDLGANTAFVGVLLDGVNVGTVQFKYSTTTATPSYSNLGSAQTVSQNKDSGRYKCLLVTSGTARHVSVFSGSGTTTDGTGLFKVGAVSVIKSWDDGPWAVNPGFAYGRESVTRKFEDDDFGDQFARASPYGRIALASSVFPLSSIDSIMRISRQGAVPFVFWLNDGDTSEAYILRLIGEAAGYQRQGPNHVQWGSLNCREVS